MSSDQSTGTFVVTFGSSAPPDAGPRTGWMPGIEHRSHKGLNNQAEIHTNLPEGVSASRNASSRLGNCMQRFVSIHDPIAHLFHLLRHEMTSEDFRELRAAATIAWRDLAQLEAA